MNTALAYVEAVLSCCGLVVLVAIGLPLLVLAKLIDWIFGDM